MTGGKTSKASKLRKDNAGRAHPEAGAQVGQPPAPPQSAALAGEGPDAAVAHAVDAVLHPGLGPVADSHHATAQPSHGSKEAGASAPAVSAGAETPVAFEPPPSNGVSRGPADIPASANKAAPSPEAAPPGPAALPPGMAALASFMPGVGVQMPDLEALGRNMQSLMEESGKVAAELAKPRENRAPAQPFRSDMGEAVKALGQVAEHWMVDPARLMQAQASLTTGFLGLWLKSAERFGKAEEPKEKTDKAAPADKRFADPAWRENPVFDFLHKAFMLGTDWANELVDKADSVDPATRERAKFYMRQISSALSPSNFVPTNPELLRETLKENGGNLVRGMKMLAEDIAAGGGELRIRQTDPSTFELGVNMAATPGKVVFRTDVMELLQYAPSTPDVLKRPLLVVPPWINKFYILDLNPEKSFVRWAVSQGLTVFVISWVNPDERHSAKDFASYMNEGILAALHAIEAVTGERDVTAMGYCVGGTLLAVTLAYMAAHGDDRISSATLLTAQVDFTHAGDLKVFAEEQQISALEAQMRGQGYLRGMQMAQAFNMLRPEDLIWTSAVNNYLKGKTPRPFDLLAWNSDSTRMPAANHSFYLRNCYMENNLAKGLMDVAGVRLDLKKVTIPIYNMAAREDHIAPALSVFTGSAFFGGPVRYVLSGSGHVAGVVNPPAKGKYGYMLGPEPRGAFEEWQEAGAEHPGSWWTDWIAWIKAQAPATVPAREPGGGQPTLGDAPGTYVRVQA